MEKKNKKYKIIKVPLRRDFWCFISAFRNQLFKGWLIAIPWINHHSIQWIGTIKTQ